jgi:diguanylate cyclase (GGDEF)-like protein
VTTGEREALSHKPGVPVRPRESTATAEFISRLVAPGGVTSLFQPLVALSDGRIIGYEALSRATEDPTFPPDQWLHAAERFGQRIDVELACLSAAALHGPPPGNALLFLNVSHRLLLDPRFDAIREALPPHVLEITEHEPIDDYESLMARVQPWLARGTLLAIDDVGAGYASMTHVLRLSPSFIKIDRALIAGIDSSHQQRSLVAALAAFSRRIHATTIAEGVETGGELDTLRELNIDVVQGFLLARPGASWPRAADPIRGRGPSDRATGFEELARAIDATTHAKDAADCVTRFLTHRSQMMPTVYVTHGTLLRCLSRHGQWLILDGIPSGVGITGSCLQLGEEILVPDVAQDPRYRAAIPGIRAEFAVPLVVDGETIGVLNVDTGAELTDSDLDAIRRSAQLLAQRLGVLGAGDRQLSALRELGRLAPWIVSGPTTATVASRTVESVLNLVNFDAAALWIRDEDTGALSLLSEFGAGADRITAIDGDDLANLDALAGELSSCYSAGGALDLAFGPTQVLRDRGVSSMFLAVLRDGSRRVGLLGAVGGPQATVDPSAVEAIELLCLHAGNRMGSLHREDQLRQRNFRDPLTGVGNRIALGELLRDRRGSGGVGWLLLADIDGLGDLNRRLGTERGDEALRALAATLSEEPLSPSKVFRFASDEFAVLLPPMTGAIAESYAAVLRDRCTEVLDGYGLGISIGMAAIASRRTGIQQALDGAMERLARAKSDRIELARRP